MEFELTANNTYGSIENARRAVLRKGFEDLRFFITRDEEGRYFPVFVGQEALQAGAHFHFNVIG